MRIGAAEGGHGEDFVGIEQAKTLDKDTLKEWTKLAAKSDTMQDFLKSIE